MTYTIVARCPKTKALGVGIATYSLGVGGYCPFLARGIAALSTQAFANPTLGPIAVQALQDGRNSDNVLRLLAGSDPGFSYRQVAIVGADGTVAMHTGDNCRVYAGHAVGDGYAAFGNLLAGEHVVSAIANSFETSKGQRLDDRLMQALEAGRDSGGQTGDDSANLAERSAALIVQGADIVEDINLRVDLHDDAVTELRRVHTSYAPYLSYYQLRARNPENTPAQDVWARENLA